MIGMTNIGGATIAAVSSRFSEGPSTREERMKSSKTFVAILIGMALSSALLILLIPSRIQETGNGVTPLIGLGALALVFAVALRHWGPRQER